MAKADRFHISKRGKPTQCRAKVGNCPLGNAPHYGSKKEADQAIESSYTESHNILSSVNGFNPENTEKEINSLVNNFLQSDNMSKDKLLAIKQGADKNAATPNKLIELHKRLIHSKDFINARDNAQSENATEEDKVRYQNYKDAAVAIIVPVSENMQHKEFKGNAINRGAVVNPNSYAPGTKEWYRARETTLGASDVATIYDYEYVGKNANPWTESAYKRVIQTKTIPATDEELEKRAENHKKEFQGLMGNGTVMEPLVVKDFENRHPELEVMVDKRQFRDEYDHSKQINLDALFIEKEEQHDMEESFEGNAASGIVEVKTSDKPWGKHVPVGYRAQGLYQANLAGVDKIIFINRSNLNHDEEYVVYADEQIDPKNPNSPTMEEFMPELEEKMRTWGQQRAAHLKKE